MTAPAPVPPHALVQQWWEDAYREQGHSLLSDFARRAALWGAEQQLECCSQWVREHFDPWMAGHMSTATRPVETAQSAPSPCPSPAPTPCPATSPAATASTASSAGAAGATPTPCPTTR